MNIGELNTLISIESFAATKDAYQQSVETWTEFASVWASVTFASGGEKFEADLPTNTKRVSFLIRPLTGLKSDMRIVLGAAIYSINAVLPQGRAEVLIETQVKE